MTTLKGNDLLFIQELASRLGITENEILFGLTNQPEFLSRTPTIIENEIIVHFDPVYLEDNLKKGSFSEEDARKIAQKLVLGLPDLGLLTNLESLVFRQAGLKELDVCKNYALLHLDCSDNRISQLILTANICLEFLNARNNAITGNFDLSENSNLKYLDCSGNKINSLLLPDSSCLEVVNVNNNYLTSLKLHNNKQIRELNCNNNSFYDEINLESLDFLSSFNCSKQNGVTSIKLSKTAPLHSLYCSQLDLGALDLTPYKNLKNLNCSYNKIKTLDLSDKPHLEYLDIQNTSIQSLNITDCISLRTLLFSEGTGSFELICSDFQKITIESLRKKFKTKDPKKFGTTIRLNQMAEEFNWDYGVKDLYKIIDNKLCDYGTALRTFWLGRPNEHYYGVEQNSHDKELYDFLKHLEAKLLNGFYTRQFIPFDPMQFLGDGTTGNQHVQNNEVQIPKVLLEKVRIITPVVA